MKTCLLSAMCVGLVMPAFAGSWTVSKDAAKPGIVLTNGVLIKGIPFDPDTSNISTGGGTTLPGGKYYFGSDTNLLNAWKADTTARNPPLTLTFTNLEVGAAHRLQMFTDWSSPRTKYKVVGAEGESKSVDYVRGETGTGVNVVTYTWTPTTPSATFQLTASTGRDSCVLVGYALFATSPDPLRVASRPSPLNGQTAADSNDTILSWQPGRHAIRHRIWFGADDPGHMVEKPAQDPGNKQFDPGDLALNTVYYWRIDEVNSDLGYVTTGPLWQFSTGTKALFPLLIFDAAQLGGAGVPVDIRTVYSDDQIPGGLNNKVSSFRLAKGYMLTVADAPDGTGPSKVYVAYDKDIVVNSLPESLNNTVSFIRVLPWRYGTKKGTAGSVLGVNASWFYLWSPKGTPDLPEREYVPMSWGGGYSQPDDIAGFVARENVSNWLGFNEPDYSKAQSGKYWDLCTVSTAVGYYKNLLGIGLRLGSPATHEEGWDGWLNTFVNQATAADMRIDFIAVHWYDWNSRPASNTNPEASAVFERLKNHLNKVYQKYKRPIWLTEWNANPHRPRSVQDGFLQLALPYLDKLGYVERYSYFQPSRGTGNFFDDQGRLTTTGTIYKNHVSTDNFAQSFPDGWQNRDIGPTGISGTTIYANGIFTVSGSGANIWDPSDEFQYAYKPITGDGEFIAKVESMITAHDPASKAGVMIRNTLDANSAHAMMNVTSSTGVQFQHRATAGGSMVDTTAAGFAAPYWVKVVRAGNVFSGYRSSDGTTWTQTGSSVTILMNATVYAGLCVTSHDDANLCDAIFSSLRLSWPISCH